MNLLLKTILFFILGFLPYLSLAAASTVDPPEESLFEAASVNSTLAAEAFERCQRYVHGWLAHADPKSGLIPRNLTRDVDLWNGRDSAADNYPFMVLTTAMTDRSLFKGRMRKMLQSEIKRTSRVDRLGDHYSFARAGFVHDTVDMERIIFDNSEYVKDGLLAITEWLGKSPWSDRALALLEDIWQHAAVETPFGAIPTTNFEVNGDLLQACSRFYWFTGEIKYLDWAIRLGDYYLLGQNHPTRNRSELRLLDHGCEVVNGLSELYLTVSQVRPHKKAEYERPVHDIFDIILHYARNEDGLLYSRFNPQTGSHSEGLCDTWGYVYDGVYTVALVDNVASYREAVRYALDNLYGKYVGACWDDRSADGFADSIEGAITLFNREKIMGAALWIDSQIRLMWEKQQPDGVIEGWHGDGNFSRTSLMYALWKTCGLRVEPWRADVRIGAVEKEGRLFITIASEKSWKGRILFDQPRYRTQMRLPMDYPRINQFPEWFTAEANKTYRVTSRHDAKSTICKGTQLWKGYAVHLQPG